MIGILSMQRVKNYGSVLQAYSLKNMVEELVHEEVKFIDLDYSRSIKVNMPIRDKGDYYDEPYLPKGKVVFFAKKCLNKLVFNIFNKKIIAFQKEELGIDEWETHDIYDVTILGSDEIFGAKTKLSLQMYGEVPNSKKIISYAAACGSAQYEGIPNEAIPRVKMAISNISAMSVRDAHTYDYISKLYSGNIEMHMDPVLMGPLKERKHKKQKMKNYMVIYAYGDRIHKKDEIEAIQNFAKKHKLKTISVGAPQYWTDSFVAPSPFDMLDLFYYADCVITDTFHGSIFSIINGCKFAVILRDSNQFKLRGLLEQLGLEKRILTNASLIEETIMPEINYGKVYNIIEEERTRTKDYLKNNLIN